MAGTHLTGEADTAQEPRPGDCFPAQGKRKQSEMFLTALFWVSSGILTHFPAKQGTPLMMTPIHIATIKSTDSVVSWFCFHFQHLFR